MIEVTYSPKFIKSFKKLPKNVQKLAVAKIEIFTKNPAEKSLKVHPLTGELKGYSSFSINYSYRILFIYEETNTVTFINIGTHSIYK